jgi:uncharacterized membrane-anchored protein
MRVGQVVGIVALMLSSSLVARADQPSAEAPQQPLHWQDGPKKIALDHDITIDLPAHYTFLPLPDAVTLMRRLGNFYNENLLGVITSDEESPHWIVSVRYNEDGHVDDKEKIDADELLKAIKEGTEQANAERVKNGFPPAHIEGWTESPHYDSAQHRLVWALTMKSDDGASLNFNTRVLGRRGVVSLNLVTPPERIETDKPHAATLLAATTFNQGARYEDFDKKTDKVAEYGLMGLILGGAGIGAVKLVKVGILAKLLAPLLKFLAAAWKLVIAFFVAIGAGIKKMFGKTTAGTPAAQNETKLPPTGTDGQG